MEENNKNGDMNRLELNKSSYLPWKITGQELPANILLMAKLMLALLLFHGFFGKIKDPFLPFLPILESFNQINGLFEILMRASFVIGASMLVFNIRPKKAIMALGLIILLVLLSSKTLFRNHIFIVACVYLIVGFTQKKYIQLALIIQVAILYFGASFNKMMELDWWSGQFIHNWLAEARGNIIYIKVSSLMPEMWLAKLMSWSSILVEFLIAVLILSKKWRSTAIWMLIIFHFGMFTILAFRFGHFVQDLFILLIAFIDWPEQGINKSIANSKNSFARKSIKILDWDGVFKPKRPIEKNTLTSMKLKDQRQMVLPWFFYLEGLYVFLLLFDFGIEWLLYRLDGFVGDLILHLIFCVICWILILSALFMQFKTEFRMRSL